VITGRDVIEPLGGALKGGGEESRIGRIVMQLPAPLPAIRAFMPYTLVYQDLENRWHATSFTVEVEQFAVKSRQLGPIGFWDRKRLPPRVLKDAQMGPYEDPMGDGIGAP
jgi:hypothetical protein